MQYGHLTCFLTDTDFKRYKISDFKTCKIISEIISNVPGLKMLSAIEDVNSETNLDVSIRVGIHTGSVLCGVVGIKRFRSVGNVTWFCDHVTCCFNASRVAMVTSLVVLLTSRVAMVTSHVIMVTSLITRCSGDVT